MADLVERLEHRARTEIRYARGMFCMHRERYLHYCEELRRARQEGDFERRRAILADLALFLQEIRYLEEKHRSGYTRLMALRQGGGFSPPAPPVGAEDRPDPTQAPGVHLPAGEPETSSLS